MWARSSSEFVEFQADVLELGSSRVGARLRRSEAFVARRRSPMESMQSVVINTCDRNEAFPQQLDLQTLHPGGEPAFVKVRPCEAVPPMRILIGARFFSKFRRFWLAKSMP